MQTKRRGSLHWILLAVVSAAPLLAQGDRGEISGTVTDATGAVVPAAQVTVIEGSTNATYKTTTSTAGDYTLTALPVGTYRVKIDVQGFKSYIANNVAVDPGGDTRLDVKLEVGTAQQSIEVTAHAQVIQTENARV